MRPTTRAEQFSLLYPDEPRYRWKQVEKALFVPQAKNFADITNLPKAMREKLAEIPWISIQPERVYISQKKDTYKAVLMTSDGLRFESVLMENMRGQWTICVSSQVGCAMKCTFCATGAMGLKRSLSSDEIADQYRFWNTFLAEHPELHSRISNVVFMGMGEPLANYENVKAAISLWLQNTDLGPTRITVSSVGVLMQLERILKDPTWPAVRIAISLHSANQKKREEIVPTTTPKFLDNLARWSRAYAKILGNNRHHITYEYTLLSGVNDTEEVAKELAEYILTTGSSLVNLIPYNPVSGKVFVRSNQARIEAFKKVILSYGIDVTQRKTMGDDIAAACGQLITETNEEAQAAGRKTIDLQIKLDRKI